MDGSKWVLASKTIAGIVVTLAGAFGIGDVLPVDFANVVGNLVNNVFIIGGAILSIYGRIVAKDSLTVLPSSTE